MPQHKKRKLENVIKQKRNNFEVRKRIVPKTSSEVLNELARGKYAFTITPSEAEAEVNIQTCKPKLEHFTAECQFEGQVFVGTGKSFSFLLKKLRTEQFAAKPEN